MSKVKYFLLRPIVLISAVGLIALPFVILGFLYGGNSIFERYGVNMNPSGISNKEIYSFWGSYLAGLATLAAVLLTIKHNADMNLYQRRSAYYDKERENIAKALLKINFSIIDNLDNQYRTDFLSVLASERKSVFSILDSILIGKEIDQVDYAFLNNLVTKLSALLKQILSEHTLFFNARNELLLTTDILSNENCKQCPKQANCNVYKHRAEFITNYKTISDAISSGFDLLHENVQKEYNYFSLHNTMITLIKIRKPSANDHEIENNKCDKDIENCKKQIEATKPFDININLDEINKVLSDKPKLIEPAQLYYIARTSKEHETCPNNF